MQPPIWQCRACGFQGQAMVREKVSVAGWVVFGLLLLVCLPLCFLGLFMKDKTAVCPRCGVNA
jgi:ribosomal protein L37E